VRSQSIAVFNATSNSTRLVACTVRSIVSDSVFNNNVGVGLQIAGYVRVRCSRFRCRISLPCCDFSNSEIRLQNCTAQFNGADGVQLSQGSSLTLLLNGTRCTRNGGNGLWLSQYSISSIAHGDFSNNGAYGIATEYYINSLVLTASTLRGNRQDGLYVYFTQQALTVSDCVVSDNGGFGLRLNSYGRVTVTRNAISANAGGGCNLENIYNYNPFAFTDNVIAGNLAGYALYMSLDLGTSSPPKYHTVSRNVLRGNRGTSALSVTTGSTTAVNITDNAILNNIGSLSVVDVHYSTSSLRFSQNSVVWNTVPGCVTSAVRIWASANVVGSNNLNNPTLSTELEVLLRCLRVF
jgi:hypothetical protein